MICLGFHVWMVSTSDKLANRLQVDHSTCVHLTRPRKVCPGLLPKCKIFIVTDTITIKHFINRPLSAQFWIAYIITHYSFSHFQLKNEVLLRTINFLGFSLKNVEVINFKTECTNVLKPINTNLEYLYNPSKIVHRRLKPFSVARLVWYI